MDFSSNPLQATMLNPDAIGVLTDPDARRLLNSQEHILAASNAMKQHLTSRHNAECAIPITLRIEVKGSRKMNGGAECR